MWPDLVVQRSPSRAAKGGHGEQGNATARFLEDNLKARNRPGAGSGPAATQVVRILRSDSSTEARKQSIPEPPRDSARRSSVVWRRQLKEERRHAVFHLRERHRIDYLLADAIEVLAAEVGPSPKVVELHDAHRYAEFLRVAMLPALQLLRQRSLHIAVHPHALGVVLAGNARHHGAVDLVERDESALEAELTGLLDDQADAARRRGHDADGVRLLSQQPQQDGVEFGHAALKELFGDDLVTQLLDEVRLHLHRPPARIVVRRDRGDTFDLRLMLLNPLPERRGLGRRRETLEREGVFRAHEPLGIREGQCQNPRFDDGLFVRLGHRSPEDGDVLDAVLGDEPIDRRHALGDDVLVIVSHDLKPVLLTTHLEATLAVDLVEDELGRLLVGNAPWRGGAGQWRRDPELDDIRGAGSARADGREERRRDERNPCHGDRWLHRRSLPWIVRVKASGHRGPCDPAYRSPGMVARDDNTLGRFCGRFRVPCSIQHPALATNQRVLRRVYRWKATR